MDPYSVTIWSVTVNQDVFIAAGSGSSHWVENMKQNPAVVLAIEDKLYLANAMQISDTSVLRAVGQAYVKKYEVEDDGTNFIEEGGLIFQLIPRP